jgi:hypothetical protein
LILKQKQQHCSVRHFLLKTVKWLCRKISRFKTRSSCYSYHEKWLFSCRRKFRWRTLESNLKKHGKWGVGEYHKGDIGNLLLITVTEQSLNYRWMEHWFWRSNKRYSRDWLYMRVLMILCLNLLVMLKRVACSAINIILVGMPVTFKVVAGIFYLYVIPRPQNNITLYY